MSARAIIRTRWAAIGATVAISLGAGGLTLVSAANGDDNVFTPIEPCRLLDTRPNKGIGGRTTPLSPADIHTLTATGDNGQCTDIPTDITAAQLNITALFATTLTHLTIWAGPTDPVPRASSLNPAPGQPPTPNAVTTEIAPDGTFNIFNNSGQVHVIVDLVGYYRPHDHDDLYYTKAQTDSEIDTAVAAIPAGPRGDPGPAGPTHGRLIRGITPIDTLGTTGVNPSITIGFDGNPVISYIDFGPGNLKVAACDDPACTSAATTTILPSSTVGDFSTSMAIGFDGNPIISYRETGDGLHVVACDDPACTSVAGNVAVDIAGSTGYYPSLTIGTDGNPVISYYDASGDGDGDLNVAACTDPACTSAVITALDTAGDVGAYTSATIGTDGNPIISYVIGSDENAGGLKVAACADPTCTSSTITSVDSAGSNAIWPSMAIGTDGNPIIAFYDAGNLNVAACDDPACTSATVNPIDSDGLTGFRPAITIGPDGNPIIGYHDLSAGDLNVAICDDPTCTAAAIHAVDTDGTTGRYPSITIGAHGNPIIAYHDETGRDLKVAALTWTSWTANNWQS